MTMLRVTIILALLTGSAQAQFFPFPGPGRAAVGSSYTGPGDIVSGAFAWWGLRAYSAAYAASTGNIADLVAVTGGAAVCTLKAATDGTADLVGTYCGGSTVSAACAAASGGSCKITRLYDQTGAGLHLTQATLSAMPALVFGPVTGLASNRPAMTFATGQWLARSGAFGISAQPLSMSAVAIRTSGTSDSGILAGANGNDAEMILRTANTMRLFAGSPNIDVTASDNAWHSLAGVFSGASSAANVDGSNTTGTLGTGAINTGSGIYMGRDSFGGSGNFNGNINEGGIWTSAISTGNMSSLSTNQHSYWGY